MIILNQEQQCFLSIFNTGSLTQSAKELGISKSTLSRRLAVLEEQVGQPLFQRVSNCLQPTEAGLIYVRFCRQAFCLEQQSQQALDELKKHVEGELFLHIHACFIPIGVLSQIKDFMLRHPKITLHLYTENQCSVEQQAPDHVWLWFGEAPAGCSLRVEPLCHWQQALYTSPCYLKSIAHVEHPNEVPYADWVELFSQECVLKQQTSQALFKIPPSRLMAENVSLQLEALSQGDGIGLLPKPVVEAFNSTAFHPLIQCLPAWQAEPISVALLYSFGHKSKRVHALIEHLKNIF